MDQHSRLARTRTREHQHIGLFTVIGDYLLLHGIVQGLDDGFPRLAGGLPPQIGAATGQPFLQDCVVVQPEIVLGQLLGPVDGR